MALGRGAVSYERGTPVEQSSENPLGPHRVTSLIRNTPLLGPYSRTNTKGPMVVLGGGAVSYERGTTVQ